MLPPDITDGAEIRAWVQATVSESLNNIGIHELYGVLLHNPLDAIGPRGAEIFAGLEACKNMGLVKKIGVSIYEREQLERTCGTYPIEIVQIPVNIFDQRLTSDELLPNMRRRGLEIHARSVFLQGLLLMAYETVPAYFNPIRQHLRNFHDACREYEVTPMSLALAFIKNCALDVALVGVNTRDQLSEIVAKYNSIPEDVRICNFDKFALHEPKFINPSLWAVGS
jgi:aryl-alcohol dehydrogenase-like predicted oxidoreductase